MAIQPETKFSPKKEWVGILTSTMSFGTIVKNYSKLGAIWGQVTTSTASSIGKGILEAVKGSAVGVGGKVVSRVFNVAMVVMAFTDAFNATTWALRYIGGENKNIHTMIVTLIDNLERGLERKSPEAKAFNEKIGSIQLALSQGNYALETELIPILTKTPPPITVDNPEEHIPFVNGLVKAVTIVTTILKSCETLLSKDFETEYKSFNTVEAYIPLVSTNLDHIKYHAERIKDSCEKLLENSTKYCAALNATANSLVNIDKEFEKLSEEKAKEETKKAMIDSYKLYKKAIN
jgi:hypothetical protein